MTLVSRAADHLKKRKAKGVQDKDHPLWALLDEKYTIGLEIRRPQERKWIICLAFLAGNQYSFFNTVTHTLNQLRPVRGRIRKVDNQIWPRVRRQISDFIKNDPIMSVVPNSFDDEDIMAAKTADKVLRSFWRNNKMKKKTRLMAGWIFGTGNVFVDHRWNPKLGPVEIGEDGSVNYLGDADVGIWSPFEILGPAAVHGDNDLHGFPWMMKAKWRGLDWIAASYSKGGLVVEEQMSRPFVDSLLMMEGTRGNLGKKVPGAVVRELYMKPNAAFPKGLFLSGANKIILEQAEWPYQKYSMEHFKDIDLPGVFYGKATMEDAIPLQKTWNRTISDIEEFNRTMGRGKFLKPHGSRMTIDPDDTHGEIIGYKPVMGHKPELLTLKGLPDTYRVQLDTVAQSLDNLFSQHEVTRGTNRGDLRSGQMVGMLREQDAHGQIPTHTIYEEGMAETMSGVLKRIKAGYEVDRMLQVVGKDEEFEVFAFKGADLRNNTDVVVKGQSTVPDSRIAREDRIENRFERGMYGNPEDPEVRRHVMNMLEDAVVKDIYSEEIHDEKLARWENRMLAQVEVPINPYDNHGIHLTELNLFRKKMEYQKLKIENPGPFAELEARFNEHYLGHAKALEEQQEKAFQQELALAGKGGQ